MDCCTPGKTIPCSIISWPLLRPDVPVAVPRILRFAGGLKPRVLVGGVVNNEIDDDADAALPGLVCEIDEIAG